MLYKLHTNILIVGVLAMGFLMVMTYERSLCPMTIGTFVAFITQMCLLISFAQENVDSYSEKTLFYIVLFYSVILAFIFMWISYYHAGDTFMFNKTDAMFYFKNSIRVVDIGLVANFERLMIEYDYEDWGGLLIDTLLLAIIPYKLFVNAVYILTGAISSVMLFKMGSHFMPEKFAFEAALAYGTSSFLVLFHCTFLKESFFVFFVICAMFYFYRAITEGKYWSYIWTILFIVLVALFRPAVSAMIVMGFVIYYAITQRGTALSFFLYLITAALFVVSLASLQGMTDRYAGGGDIEGMADRSSVENYSSGFSYFVSLFAGPFGPFPTLFPKEAGDPGTLNYYGSGLTYRLFLVVPFWAGVVYAIKRHKVELIPMIGFTVIEMLTTGIALASLELRKVLMHVPFTFILSFFGLYQWKTSNVTGTSQIFFELSWFVVAIAILVVWNIIR